MAILTIPDIDGSVQDCNISIANALEILQSCTQPSINKSSSGFLGMYILFSEVSLKHYKANMRQSESLDLCRALLEESETV